MAIMHQNSKDSNDFRRKLWDHLAIMADFELDIDAPFPPPDTFTLNQKPRRIPYNTGKIRYLHYGRVIQDMILQAVEFEEGEEKKALISIIANHMKKLYLTWNREIVNDEIIFNDIYTLSEGKIKLNSNDLKLTDSKELMKTRRTKKTTKQTKRKK